MLLPFGRHGTPNRPSPPARVHGLPVLSITAASPSLGPRSDSPRTASLVTKVCLLSEIALVPPPSRAHALSLSPSRPSFSQRRPNYNSRRRHGAPFSTRLKEHTRSEGHSPPHRTLSANLERPSLQSQLTPRGRAISPASYYAGRDGPTCSSPLAASQRRGSSPLRPRETPGTGGPNGPLKLVLVPVPRGPPLVVTANARRRVDHLRLSRTWKKEETKWSHPEPKT